MVAAAAGTVWVQFPWEAGEGEPVLSVVSRNTSPFEQKELAFITRLAPSFLNGLNMIRDDWAGMQTAAPAPGEVVHTYMSGLGPVIGDVRTGVPAPLDSLRPIEGTLHCRFLPHASYAETLWAGLAPGMIEIYQVTFRMPPDAVPFRFTGAQCELISRWGAHWILNDRRALAALTLLFTQADHQQVRSILQHFVLAVPQFERKRQDATIPSPRQPLLRHPQSPKYPIARKHRLPEIPLPRQGSNGLKPLRCPVFQPIQQNQPEQSVRNPTWKSQRSSELVIHVKREEVA